MKNTHRNPMCLSSSPIPTDRQSGYDRSPRNGTISIADAEEEHDIAERHWPVIPKFEALAIVDRHPNTIENDDDDEKSNIHNSSNNYYYNSILSPPPPPMTMPLVAPEQRRSGADSFSPRWRQRNPLQTDRLDGLSLPPFPCKIRASDPFDDDNNNDNTNNKKRIEGGQRQPNGSAVRDLSQLPLPAPIRLAPRRRWSSARMP